MASLSTSLSTPVASEPVVRDQVITTNAPWSVLRNGCAVDTAPLAHVGNSRTHTLEFDVPTPTGEKDRRPLQRQEQQRCLFGPRRQLQGNDDGCLFAPRRQLQGCLFGPRSQL